MIHYFDYINSKSNIWESGLASPLKTEVCGIHLISFLIQRGIATEINDYKGGERDILGQVFLEKGNNSALSPIIFLSLFIRRTLKI